MVTMSATALGSEPEPATLVDMSKLTQSELQMLSLRSSSSFHRRLASSDQFFLPKIDRAIFNESAGSRGQTYSSPDPTFSSSTCAAGTAGHHLRNRVAGLHSTLKLPSQTIDDPERRENIAIIRSLKHYISLNPSPSFTHVDLIPLSLPAPVGVFSDGLVWERKRKRGQNTKAKMNSNVEHKIETEWVGTLEMKNKNGVAIDIDALAGLDDPYGEELRKRTEGLQGEEELLGFLRDLGGEWGSRRKRRKIVDAGIFGEFLPIGWKLLLGLRRKEGCASIFCRRYVSPSGQQFVSCKEISTYFRSYLGLQAASQSMSQGTDDIQQACRLDNMALLTGQPTKDNSQSLQIISSSTVPTQYLQNELKKEGNASAEKLTEVQEDGLFECHKCSATFNEKDSYLQHLVSFHQRTLRRYRIGSSVGDGVIMKDGKFECQFCHKVFEERRRYNGHVGIHVRNYMRRKEESLGQGSALNKMESSSGNELPSRLSKMDALIEIAQCSIQETLATGDHHELDGSPAFAPNVNLDNDMKVDSPINDMRMEGTDSEQTLDEEVTNTEDEDAITDVKEKLQEDLEHESDVNVELQCEIRVTESVDGQNDKTIEMCSGEDCQTVVRSEKRERVAGSMDGRNDKTVEMCAGEDCQTVTFFNIPKAKATDEKESESLHAVLNDNLGSKGTMENPISDAKIPIADTSAGHAEMATDDVMQTIQTNHKSSIQQCDIPDTFSKEKNNVAPFEELKYDELEPMEFQFATVEEDSHPIPEEPIDMEPSSAMDGQFSNESSVPIVPEELTLDKTATRHQRTSGCVWCGVEFSHEGNDSDVQSDSVGFMCPTCKVKISGQLNAFGNGSPADGSSL